MPQLRQNPITGDWVVIAPERAKRPSDFMAAETTKAETVVGCPFDASSETYREHNLKDFETDTTYVSPNKFPAFVEDPTKCSPRTYPVENNFYRARPATGGHDLIIMKDHNLQLYDFSEDLWRDLFEVARKRYIYWRHDCNTEQAMLIYNQGQKAGASIFHPHAQIFASNIVPNQIGFELKGAGHYHEHNGTCVFCDFIAHEKQQNLRVVYENDHFLVVTFYAARFPFEMWVLPKLHQARYEDMTPEQNEGLAAAMHEATALLGKTLHKPAFNFYLHDLPTTASNPNIYHWHLEIAPRVSNYGGYELGADMVVDVIAPEDAAKYLKQA